MASVGAFVLIRHMLRLICGRRFALITVAMAIVVAYQLTDDLFISYGTVGADSLLGVDLPPLFMAAMTMGGSEAFGCSVCFDALVPVVLSAALSALLPSWPMRSRARQSPLCPYLGRTSRMAGILELRRGPSRFASVSCAARLWWWQVCPAVCSSSC